MIVRRWTTKTKRNRGGEVAAWLKGERERLGYADRMRIYVSDIGTADLVVTEWEFESLAEMEKKVQEYFANPESLESAQKVEPLLERGGTTEIWRLIE